jgi:excisionase family DNA binding protein
MSGKQTMSDRLTAQAAADALGYHIDHVYRLLRSGVMKAEQFNRVWLIPKSEVERIRALQTKGGRLPKGEGTIDQD